MMGLYRLAAETGDADALAAAEHGLAFVQANLVRHDDWTAFAEPGQDATARARARSLTIALVQRRLATGDDGEDELLRELGRFLAAQQQTDGSVLGRWSQETQSARARRMGDIRDGPNALVLRAPRQALPGRGLGRAARNGSRATSPRAATTSRATSSPSPTTGQPTASPSSDLTGWTGRRSPTRASWRASSASTPASSRRAARAASTESCAASRPRARASGLSPKAWPSSGA